jgi:4-hydroxy-tetrahydrodipicolinate reductase
MTDLLICGIGGKMGKIVYETAKKNTHINKICGVDAFADILKLDCNVYSSFDKVAENVDVIIDFSRPEALNNILNFAIKNKCGVVLATTGYNDEQISIINDASKKIAVFMTANYSLGVNLISNLCKIAAQTLGNDYDIEIIEKHHNQKVDAPSGTALMIANEINSVFEGDKKYVYGREGKDCKRDEKEIGIHAVRGGTIVGEHEIIFTANDETITISHSALSKQIFASGAVPAAVFIDKKPARLYSMKDIIK